MFDKIMPPGKKIKEIRLFLKATQKEVADGICTKNRISQIEKHEKKINLNLAIGITENLNRIAQLKKIDMVITVEELMMDEDDQSNNILTKNIINHLHEVKSVELFERKLMEAEMIIGNYIIRDEIKIQLYKLASNFYYNKNSYHKSNEMCSKGLMACLSSENRLEEAHFYVNKSRNSTSENYHDQSLIQLIEAELINNKICNEDLWERILFNRAQTYKNMERYTDALISLNELKDKFKLGNKSKLLTVLMLIANCLNDNKQFDKAEIQYKEILKIASGLNDQNFISQAYRNLSEVYYNKEDYEVAAEYIKEALKEHPHNYCLNETLYFTAKVLKHTNEDTEMYLLRSLELCEKDDLENVTLIEAIIYELVLVYIKRDDNVNLELMLNKIEELQLSSTLILTELSKYYRYKNKEMDTYLSDKLINHHKEKNKYLK
ncbi:helix-turn-helix transcriptional regulator [Clostridium sp. C2-6-12]|uniref:helix-turn-helix domain-containing protein n=1 Tax=Clostridium sp. C2-6-12 TaxID=2698832 RepID=UPI0013712245|nr:helix-turn-helix transcriptional regulator [Clostridium sp. C2-6-12]